MIRIKIKRALISAVNLKTKKAPFEQLKYMLN